MTRRRLAALLALAFAVPAAGATEYAYRSVMPDGSVRYGEAPEPHAKSIKRIKAPPGKSGTVVITPEEKTRALPAPPAGVRAVLEPPPRERPDAAQQGRLQAPSQLPRRGGYY